MISKRPLPAATQGAAAVKMLIKEMLAYLVCYAYACTGAPQLYGIVCSLLNAATRPDAASRAGTRGLLTTPPALTDDDGDAFTRFDFYHDERDWDNEVSDMV